MRQTKRQSALLVTLSLLAVGVMAASATPALAETKESVYKLVNDGKILAHVTSNGTHKSIRVQLVNASQTSYRVVFPYGTIFWSGDDKYQNLALVVTSEIVAPAQSMVQVHIETACMNAGRAVAGNGFADWTVRYDSGLANLITFFYTGQAMFGHAIKPEYLSTEKKRRDFLQGVVWVYGDATKKQMKKFARTYMFESRDEADAWVDLMYPMAKQMIDLYKVMHGSRTLH